MQDHKPFDLAQFIRSPLKRRAYNLLSKPLNSVLSISGLERELSHSRENSAKTGRPFLDCLHSSMGVTIKVDPASLAKVPTEGPVVILSNHPFGLLDASLLCQMLSAYRPDCKFLANHILTTIPEANPFIIPVDPFNNEDSPGKNLRPMRDAIRWLRDGHLLATFPAGEVAHLQLKKREIMDPPWSSHIASIIHRTKATAIPIFISGRNSLLFQALGLVHPILRTAMLTRELANKRSREIEIHIGTPIPHSKIERFDSDQDRIDFLRVRSHILPHRAQQPAKIEEPESDLPTLSEPPPASISPTLQAEVDSLPQSCCTLRKGDFAVYVVTADKIPNLLPEIGRQRELTFRLVGEGTGSDSDIDRFDDYYLHAFAWDHGTSNIVGAYRIGQTDTILPTHGLAGLYTSTLFKFEPEFIHRLDPALELGRSFICHRYQKKHSSLALLWKGILRWVASTNPHYKTFFGPVSISQEYNLLSKNLIVQFLRRKLSNPQVSAYAKPRNPFKTKKILGLDKAAISKNLRNIEDVSALVSEIEDDGKSLPMLIKHYLKMNATLLNFNVDPDFSDVLDGLLMSDMTTTDPKLLKLYMGKELRDQFLAHHQKEPPIADSRPAAAPL